MKERVYSYKTLTSASEPIQNLSFLEQVRMVIDKVLDDPANELKKDDAVTEEYMTRKANLMDFLVKATAPIRGRDHRSVRLKINSTFASVLDEVLNSPRFANFYRIKVYKPTVEYDIEYFITVEMEAI